MTNQRVELRSFIYFLIYSFIDFLKHVDFHLISHFITKKGILNMT